MPPNYAFIQVLPKSSKCVPSLLVHTCSVGLGFLVFAFFDRLMSLFLTECRFALSIFFLQTFFQNTTLLATRRDSVTVAWELRG